MAPIPPRVPASVRQVERNANYRAPNRRPPARPRSATQAQTNVYADDAGGRTAHYRLTGQDSTARTNDVRWGGQGPDALAALFQGTPPPRGGGGGGGGGGGSYGGGGGGGGAAGPSQAQKDAYMAMWRAAQNDGADVWDRYEQTIRGQYDPGRINTRYDQAGAGVTGAAEAGNARLAPIMQELGDRAATARTAVNQAFGAGDARLRALQAEYANQMGSQVAGLDDVLGRFDAGNVAASGEQNLMNLFANGRVANSGAQTVYDAGLADRPAVYGGLQADVQSGINRDQTGLMNQIAMQRTNDLAANDAALQQALGSAGVQRMQAEQARQQELLKLRAELADMGITV